MQPMESDDDGEDTSWVSVFEERKRRIVEAAAIAQEELDPNGNFAALPDVEKTRLTKSLVRLFLFSAGAAPALPIPKEEVHCTFESARRESSLASSLKLFPYFLAEAQKKLADVFGIEVQQLEKQITSAEARRKRSSKPARVFYVTSLLPKEIRLEFEEPSEKELLGVLGLLVRLVVVSDGKLTKSDAMELLGQVGFRAGAYHATFGQWEKTIFDEALRRRMLITSRMQPDVFELGEAAKLQMGENMSSGFLNLGSRE